MAKHIHIWLRGSTQDADGPAHVPAGSSKGGQFTSGSGGGGGSAAPKQSHNKGASALHAFQAKFNQQLKESGHGHLVKGVAEKRRAEAERLSKSASQKTASPAAKTKTVSASSTGKPTMKVDPISHRTGSDPSPKASNTAKVTAERAEANAAHHAGLYHSTKDPEARAHHKAEYQRWKKEAASLTSKTRSQAE